MCFSELSCLLRPPDGLRNPRLDEDNRSAVCRLVPSLRTFLIAIFVDLDRGEYVPTVS